MVGVIGRQRVCGLPGFDVQRKLEHLGMCVVVAVQYLGAQHAFLRDVRGALGRLDMRRKLIPVMGRSGDLGQGAERETREIRFENRRRIVPRGFEREAVVDVRRDRPQLFPALDRLFASFRELDQIVPRAARAHPVDGAQQRVKVRGLDEVAELRHARHARRAAIFFAARLAMP
jgi:hypothetical protein